MKNGLVLAGVGLFVVGLIALFFGLLAMVATPCVIGSDCTPGISGNIVGFPAGLGLVIVGSILWTAGATQVGGETRNPLAQVGFFTIFGLSFLGLGIVMLVADRQPGVDHTTNVLTILGGMFSLVGLGSIAADFLMGRSGARDAQILATGMRGRAAVLGVRDTGVTVNMNPMIALDLRVEMPGQPVFTKTARKVISRLDVSVYRPGLVLSVAADPARPQDVVVDWDRAPIADADAALDPVTGQPMVAADVASILRAAADRISTSGSGATSGQPVSSADLATVLRNASAAAARAADAADASSNPAPPSAPVSG
jgi:hypothetical protein